MANQDLTKLSSLLAGRSHLQGQSDLKSYQRSAAVALILGGSNSQEILFIHRSEREGDPWSGHIALPGGGVEPRDVSAVETAIRETNEEVGLDLERATHFGLLKRMQLHKLGSPIDFGLECHVFGLQSDKRPSLSLDPDEVREAFWVPKRELFNSQNVGEETFHFSGISRSLPCIKIRGKIIWGITYMLLSEFQKVLVAGGEEDLFTLPEYPYSKRD